jgi:hypothetical protein
MPIELELAQLIVTHSRYFLTLMGVASIHTPRFAGERA